MIQTYDKKEIESVVRVLSDGKPRTTFEIAEELKPMSNDPDAQHVYCILVYPLQGKVNHLPTGKYTLRR